jgi:hypothetical protein
MTRFYLIKNSEDCIGINNFIEGLEHQKIEYKIEYGFEKNITGILIIIQWEE